MDYKIRKLKQDEYGILADFLYEAIYIPQGVDAPPRSIIEQPELQLYISQFGKEADYALAAEADGRIVGVAWARIMEDYGHIDDETPSLAISLYKKYRGQGIGTELMRQLLQLLKENNYKRASLSVQKANYACKMYQKLGFETVEENKEEYIMVKQLTK